MCPASPAMTTASTEAPPRPTDDDESPVNLPPTARDGVRFVILDIFPGYLIGSDGSVWSRLKRRVAGVMDKDYKRLSQSLTRGGYFKILMVHADSRRRTVPVHSLVCLAFHGPRPDGLVCRHENGKRKDNRADNLSYGTRKDNSADAIRHQTTNRGERASTSKLTWEQVKKIRGEKGDYRSRKKMADEYGVSEQTIRRVINNKTWVPFTS